MIARPMLPSGWFCAGAWLVLATLGLSGCASQRDLAVNTVPDDYRSRHPIIVGESTQDLDILVASSDTRLTHPDATRVEEFAARFRSSRAAVLRVQVPMGTRNARAADIVSDSLLKVLSRSGVARSRVLVSPYRAADNGEAFPIRLSFNAVTAGLDHACGQWPTDLGDTYQNRNYENFGCATQSNLAAQISDPRDLLGPRGMSEIDAERRTDVIGKYRRGEVTASEAPTTESTYNW
ncbi:CpaD family pilus assembly lipoprotein [Aureimonas sp. ME7]|uniref:CpaD family pilus assembly protein n=1 Tax=Aureimonas sp. ME7 TaxID=2744252 RepID=UPI0015F49A21|nr:CpaD family pilus assembly lipoprotein [Aureimonas sp. ME7]